MKLAELRSFYSMNQAKKTVRKSQASKPRQPFWEESYKRKGKTDTFYDGKPSPDVILAGSMLDKGSCILDLGCGEGRNAIYLAQLGFKVMANDISKPGIDKLQKVSKELKLDIKDLLSPAGYCIILFRDALIMDGRLSGFCINFMASKIDVFPTLFPPTIRLISLVLFNFKL